MTRLQMRPYKCHLPLVAAIWLVPVVSVFAQAGMRLEGELSRSQERLTGDRARWGSTAIDVLARDAERRAWYGRVRETSRFNLADSEVMAGTYQPIGQNTGITIEAAVSPTHHVLARHSVYGAMSYRLPDGWGLQAGLRRSSFEQSRVSVVSGMVERYIGAFRLAYTVYGGRPDGAGTGASHRLQASWYYTDESFLSVAATSGREVENIVPTGVLTSRIRGTMLSGRHFVHPAWAFTYEIGTQRQGELYTRRGVTLGLRHVF